MKTIELGRGEVTIPEVALNRFAKVTGDKLVKMAHSIRTQGQITPVVVTGEKAPYTLVAGLTRSEAVEMIRDGFEYNGKTYDPIPDFTLRAELVAVKDAKDAKLKGITENAERNDYSPVDYAYLINDLRENVFTSKNSQTAKICEFFGKTKAWVSRISSILQLPEVALQLVHKGDDNGGISYSVGNEMLVKEHGLTEADILTLCEKPEELTIRKVLDYVENKNKPTTAEGETTAGEGATGTESPAQNATGTVKVKNRTIQDVMSVFAKLADKSDELNTERVQKIALKFAQFIERKCGEENLVLRIREFCA